MNKPGTPRLLAYWKRRYLARREAFFRLGLNSKGQPRKHDYPINRHAPIADPMVARAHHNQRKLELRHAAIDKLHAAGLTARGTVPKQPRDRHRSPNFINPLAPPSDQKEQAQWRKTHTNKYHNARYHRLAAERRALGLTTKGQPRKRNRISATELAWRQLRSTMNIAGIELPSGGSVA